MESLAQIVLLLAVAVAVIAWCKRLHVPTSLGYLLVGLILGPYTFGPTVYVPEFEALAEFGVVFLLFTIGLSFSLPQLHALREKVLWLGTAQVALTTLAVALLLWALGLPAAAAFVLGAVFAQSSSTIIASQLAEQGEEGSSHGRLGLAMSVFQDVTAVPFLVLIPVLGVAANPGAIAVAVGWALVSAVAAFALVFYPGRWLLGPLFHFLAQRRSAELFTLAVLLVILLAAWTTDALGLSLAFGAFLAGMILGDTAFRHQVESSIRPFRDVLLGLFFVGIGMRIDPLTIATIWHWALLGALLILVSKILIVSALAYRAGFDPLSSWRTGLLLAVGGEFGFALIGISLDNHVIGSELGQIALTSVLFAMVSGALLIRFNGALSGFLLRGETDAGEFEPGADPPHVLIGGYGRVGHTIAVLLHEKGVPFIAVDSDPARVARGRGDGFQVVYGDIADLELLASLQAERVRLAVVTVDKPDVSLAAVTALRTHCSHVPVIARAKDLAASSELLAAGAIHAHPESIESSLRLGAVALETLSVPDEQIEHILQDVRDSDYQPLIEGGDDPRDPHPPSRSNAPDGK